MGTNDRRVLNQDELQRFRDAMDISGDAIYLVDRATMRFVDVNQTACKRMGYSREELLGMGPQDLLKDSRENIERLYDEVIAAGAAGMTAQSTAHTRDGRESTTELHRRALRMDGGWIIVSIARDITQRKHTEQALLESERRYRESTEELRLFADNVPAMTVSWDTSLRCRFVNRRYAEFFGFTVEKILGRHLREIVGEEVYEEIEPHFALALQGQEVSYQRIHKPPGGGEARHTEVKLLPHLGADGRVQGVFSVIADITEHKQTEERIRHVAHHDSLTGLPNRVLFNDRLEQSIRFARRDKRQFALLYLDLDRFKPVNDTLGHAAGDELLKSVAARLRAQVRQSDTVARIGGDEFTVILADIATLEDARAVAGKIAACLTAPFLLDRRSREVTIGTSIGIAIFPNDAGDADSLVKVADAAMYQAKVQPTVSSKTS
jgi:diguanylate cyclase (GGDEF)-like protein/PAS domain S-box-containing protein